MDENPLLFIVRRGKASDCKEVCRLIQELAEYQKMGKFPRINADVLERDGFMCSPPLFYLFVAHLPDSEQLIGYALYYFKYSTWKGKAIYLEDLYCSQEYRKKGVGAGLFKAVIKEGLDTGCQQMDFDVIEWNPARKFYDRFGAFDITEKDSWHMYRMTRELMENVFKFFLHGEHLHQWGHPLSFYSIEFQQFPLWPIESKVNLSLPSELFKTGDAKWIPSPHPLR